LRTHGAERVCLLARSHRSGHGRGLRFRSSFLGRTGIGVQFFDGQTDQLIGEYADMQFGKHYVGNFSKGITAGAEDGWKPYGKSLKSWGYADEAFTGWATHSASTSIKCTGSGLRARICADISSTAQVFLLQRGGGETTTE
jgi:hypothetical protein